MKFILNFLLLIILVLTATAIQPVSAQEMCVVGGQASTQALPGVTLTWDSSFFCWGIPQTGTYAITVTVHNDSASTQTIAIDTLRLSHTTPRPGGGAPAATAVASGLPVTLAPGASGSFAVSGSYQLVKTAEGHKANLHLRVVGHAVSSTPTFQLGSNIMLRGEDHADPADPGNAGPPAWAPGPPPWAIPDGNTEQDFSASRKPGPPTYAGRPFGHQR